MGHSVYLQPNMVQFKIKKKQVEAIAEIEENVDKDVTQLAHKIGSPKWVTQLAHPISSLN